MIAPANPRRATTQPVVTFQVDDQAEPGSVVPALARLLIDLDRRRKATAQAAAGDGNGQDYDGGHQG